MYSTGIGYTQNIGTVSRKVLDVDNVYLCGEIAGEASLPVDIIAPVLALTSVPLQPPDVTCEWPQRCILYGVQAALY